MTTVKCFILLFFKQGLPMNLAFSKNYFIKHQELSSNSLLSQYFISLTGLEQNRIN